MQYYILNMEHLHYIRFARTEASHTLSEKGESNSLNYQLIYLSGGAWHVTIGANAYEAQKDTLLFLPPQLSYVLRSEDTNATSLRIGFLPAPFSTHENRLCSQEECLADLQYYAIDDVQERLTHIPLFMNPTVGCRYRSLIEQVCTEYLRPAPGTNLLASTYLHALLARISTDNAAICRSLTETTGDPYPLIHAVCEYLNTHYTRHISLNELSETFHLSAHYLCTLFRETTGFSVVSYLNARRLEIAKLYLVNTDCQIQDIARAVGINDEFYFSRLFKRLLGMCPSDFRRQYRSVS